MKIVILEGISSSGKSSVAQGLLSSKPKDLTVKIYNEKQTHIPIMDKRDELHSDFFGRLVRDACQSQSDLVVFDRLYLTQAFRAAVSPTEYEEIEDMLTSLNAQTIFLKVNEDAIAKRIQHTSTHRSPEWAEYYRTKGSTIEDVAQTYVDQQRALLRLLEQSKVPYKIFNTTDHNYSAIITDILKPELRA